MSREPYLIGNRLRLGDIFLGNSADEIPQLNFIVELVNLFELLKVEGNNNRAVLKTLSDNRINNLVKSVVGFSLDFNLRSCIRADKNVKELVKCRNLQIVISPEV